MSHVPVLLREVIQYLDPKPGEFIIDGTVDGGGHAAEIAKLIAPGGKFLGIDWDPRMAAKCKAQITGMFVQGNYADLPMILKERGIGKADGLLLDLGLSSEQLENSGRGFSFAKDEPLLMTYDPGRLPARSILKGISEYELARVLKEYGEERFAKQVAKAIVSRRKVKPIETSRELAEAISEAVPGRYEQGRINPATRTFQALRIYVNDELGNLAAILDSLLDILKPDGRAVVIAFHSLEDRLVKQRFKEMEGKGQVKILTKKAIRPTAEEISKNPRSRSAKLRAIRIQ